MLTLNKRKKIYWKKFIKNQPSSGFPSYWRHALSLSLYNITTLWCSGSIFLRIDIFSPYLV